MIAPDPTMPELDIAAMVAYLSEHGYSVRKARASRPKAAAPILACVHCGAEAAVSTRVGARKPKDRTEVGLCVDCYRFGPFLHAAPMVPKDAERYARLLRVWRRAHNRWARRRRVQSSGWFTGEAERFAGRILKAIQAEPMMSREYAAERNAA